MNSYQTDFWGSKTHQQWALSKCITESISLNLVIAQVKPMSVPSESVCNLTEVLLSNGSKMAGLGARDTLRLEAGLCLYGNDITQDTLPPSGEIDALKFRLPHP